MKKGILSFAVFSLFLMDCQSQNLLNHPSFNKEWDLRQSWFLSPAQAYQFLHMKAQFLDARGRFKLVSSPVPSISVDWQEFSSTQPYSKGNLLFKEEILVLLKKKNLDLSIPILVFGDPINGWGEEGRIVWMLRSIGIHKSFIVDGGIQGLKQAIHLSPPVKDFSKELTEKVQYDPVQLSVDSEQIRNSLNDEKFIIFDAREKREYFGKTPYGESRGGHISNAKWLYYRDFLDSDGFVLDEKKVRSILQGFSATKEKVIASYCTGGVRSAWLTSVLRSYGYNSKNYAGSMWEWSSKDPVLYPMEK